MAQHLCANAVSAPYDKQGKSPALVHLIFAEFLDLCNTAELDSVVCNATLELVRVMSHSYLDTSGSEALLKPLRKYFGDAYKGRTRGGEDERAKVLREKLLQLMTDVMVNKPSTLEPSTVLPVRDWGAALLTLHLRVWVRWPSKSRRSHS